MRTLPRLSCFISLFLLALLSSTAKDSCLSPRASTSQDLLGQRIARRGEKIFVQNWKPETIDDRTGELGPAHNADSCFACHHQQGPGGGGDERGNVFLLTFLPSRKNKKADRLELEKSLSKVSPEFVGRDGIRSSIIFHHLNTHPDYAEFRAQLLGLDGKKRHPDETRRKKIREQNERRIRFTGAPVRLKPYGDLNFLLTQRNTPALFGAGMIDRISFSDLEELVQLQSKRHDGISGRIPLVAERTPGRFGWRGQMASSRGFVLAACAVELGLNTEDKFQVADRYSANLKKKRDLGDDQVSALARFVEDLPIPQQVIPENTLLRSAIRRGEKVFQQATCAVCHPRNLGPAEGIFSDLLLHDMGSSLADPVAAPSIRIKVGEEKFFGGYLGNGVIDVFEMVPPGTKQEWKTPPLWGVADSAPYLHDGRAKNLRQAILMHGGEANESVKRFRRFTRRDQNCLIEFLKSLRAPQRKTILE